MHPSDDQVREMLLSAIRSMNGYYEQRGIFQQRFGFGERPAIVVVDFAYGWTDDAYAGGSKRLDGPVMATRRLLDAAGQRLGGKSGVPIVYTTSPYRPESGDPPFKSAADRSAEFRPWDRRACEIDERLAPRPQDLLIEKDNASAFFGTHLAGYLIQHRVMQHQCLHPRHRDRCQELPFPSDHHRRLCGRPFGRGTRLHAGRHPGALCGRGEPGPGARLSPHAGLTRRRGGCQVPEHGCDVSLDGRENTGGRPKHVSRHESMPRTFRLWHAQASRRRSARTGLAGLRHAPPRRANASTLA